MYEAEEKKGRSIVLTLVGIKFAILQGFFFHRKCRKRKWDENVTLRNFTCLSSLDPCPTNKEAQI